MAAPPSAREHTLRSLVPSAAPRAWQPCRRHRGQPLTDADGQVLKVGSTVVDSMFGEGIARGTVSLSKGDGVNGVKIDRTTGVGGNNYLNAGKPPSRGIENLKLATVARLQPGWQQRVQTCAGTEV